MAKTIIFEKMSQKKCIIRFIFLTLLEEMACYAGLLLAPAEGFGRGKKELIMMFRPIFGNFWCPVVTLVPFTSNFERNPKKRNNQKINQKSFKKIQKIPKIQKVL